MTWKRAALYWLGFLALAAYYRVAIDSDRPQPLASRRPFLEIATDQITALDVDRRGQRLHAERVDGSWRATTPAGSAVPSDLIGALVDSLTSIPDVEVVAETVAATDDFGLQPPAATITLARAQGAPIVIDFGQLNPTSTAVYARRSDSPRVYLLGRNLDYYLDLLLSGVEAR
ncbi:MAG: DUF4340 domain-containing protein [Deltaproteobacteria bacterium]|nr:DUF4340 domain-containing protein [Deltaproteobacteria bacterium]